ncbi:MAG: type II toxin-antitoxin system Phd/YefM family antitoxin [Desulfuromonadaceae bacterium]|nr:type II toxin-antitoxin system Phd/YefM family antitoxin [Desulfuromonadaceae bacterium]
MSTLLEHSSQAISVTEVSRSAKTIFDRLSSGEQEKYVVMRNNAPAAVMMPVSVYEALMDELDDLHIQLTAQDRLRSFDREKAISHAEMLKRFADEDES